ncbi:MAG: LysM peptidoglycan-binding domain-containing protein [Chloroflexota bacterium]
MTERTRVAGTTPAACPFLALEEDRDRRAAGPDGRHRCYAQADPLPPSLAWQRSWCMAPIFSGCSIFLAWAARAAAPAEPADGSRPDGEGSFDAPAPRPGAAGRGVTTPEGGDGVPDPGGSWADPPPWVADPELRTTAGATAPPAPTPPYASGSRPARTEERPVRIPGERSGPLSGTFGARRGADPAIAPSPAARPAARPTPPLATGAAAFPVPAVPDLGLVAPDAPGPEEEGQAPAVPPPPTQGWLSALLARQQPDAPDPEPLPDPGPADGSVYDDLDLPPIAAGRAPATARPAPWAREAQPPGPAPRGAATRPAAARSAAASVVEGAAADDMGATGRRRRVPIDMRAPQGITSQAAPGRSAGSGEWNQPRASRIPRPSWRDDVPAIVPPVAIGGAILLLVAVLLFLLPGFLAGGGGTPAPASPSPVPSAVADPSATPEPLPTTEAGATLRTYKVQRGDNLIDIARRFGVELAQLICINPGLRRDPDTLYFGTTLTIPPGDYVCRKPTRQTRG